MKAGIALPLAPQLAALDAHCGTAKKKRASYSTMASDPWRKLTPVVLGLLTLSCWQLFLDGGGVCWGCQSRPCPWLWSSFVHDHHRAPYLRAARWAKAPTPRALPSSPSTPPPCDPCVQLLL